MYSVYYESKKVKKTLDKFPSDERERILEKVENKLKHYSPMMKGVKKLKGTNKGKYRIRIGNIRVMFKKYDKEKKIVISTIKPRDSIYKDMS